VVAIAGRVFPPSVVGDNADKALCFLQVPGTVGTKDRIKDILKQLENNPLKHSGIKQMFGEWAGYHRIRVGKLRIIF
jgi:hypothetical protein